MISILPVLMMCPLLVVLLYWMVSMSGQAVPFNGGEGIIQPYLGEKAILAYALTAFAVFSLASKHFILFPETSKDEKKHLLLYTMSEMPTLMGFVIGFITRDFWIILPFFGLSILDFAYTYIKLQGKGPAL